MPVYEFAKSEPPKIANYSAYNLKAGDKLSNKSGKRVVEVKKQDTGTLWLTEPIIEKYKLPSGEVETRFYITFYELTYKQVERRFPVLLA